MEKKFEIKQSLRVFQKILDHGQRVNDEYRLNDMWAYSDFDGYTVIIHDAAVTLHIFFHNTHKFTYKRQIDLDTFIDKLIAIDRMQL